MIITVDYLKQHVKTNKLNWELEAKLLALEFAIRKYTNNNFQKVGLRFVANTDQITTPLTQYLKIGDTLQVSQSPINNGLYTIKSITGEIIGLNEPIIPEPNALFTKVEYPVDVQMGVVEIMRWKLKNEEQNYNPEAEKEVQSETISRHSVTYKHDTSEEAINPEFGVPVKYTAFLKRYMKARF